MTAFAVASTSLRPRLRHPRRKRVCHPVRMSSQQHTPPPTLSRRALLINASLVGSALMQPLAPTHAYSSPYKPGQKGEQNLPDRRYEDEVKRVVTTPSGLQYFDLSEGSGTQAALGSTVFVYYTARLGGLYGIKIQSTYDDQDVVPGVSEALTGMRVGGMRRAVLPPSVAYSSPDMKPAVTEFFARRRLLSVLETNRDATIVFE